MQEDETLWKSVLKSKYRLDSDRVAKQKAS